MKNNRSLLLAALFLCSIGLFVQGCQNTPAKAEKKPAVVSDDQDIVKKTFEQCRERPIITFLLDKTQSSAEDLLENQAAKLREIMFVLCPEKVSIVNFGLDGFGVWHAPETTIGSRSIPESIQFDESQARINATAICKGRVNCVRKTVNDQKHAFNENNIDDLRSFNNSREQNADAAVVEILKPPEKEPPCTDLNELGNRAANTSADVVFVVSDGKHDCRTKFEPTNFPEGKKVVVLLLPLAVEPPGNSFQLRMENVKANYRNASVLPLNSVTSEAILDAIRRPKRR